MESSTVNRWARLGRLALASIIVLTLAWQVIGRAMADQAVRAGAPELALRFRPHSPDALELRAEARLRDKDAKAAAALAHAALEGAPNSVRALRLSALAEEQLGNGPAAAALMSRSAGWGWRDTPTHIWLFQKTSLAGNFTAAMQHADALLRRDRAIELVTPILIAASIDPTARATLITRLVDKPDWRTPFLRDVGHRSKTLFPGAESLFRELATSDAPGTPEEAAPLLWQLTANGRHRQAHVLWRDLFASGAAPLVIDSGLTSADLGKPTTVAVPFEWRAATTGSSYAEIATPPIPFDGAALLVEHDGDGATQFVAQTLVLGPGRYELSAVVTPNSGGATERIAFGVVCEGGEGVATGAQREEPMRGTWRRIVMSVEIPASGCGGQILQVGARPRPGRRISAWIDNVTVQPMR